MNSLVAAHLLQSSTPRLASPAAEDQYYCSHAPHHRSLLALVPLAAIVAVLALAVNLAPH